MKVLIIYATYSGSTLIVSELLQEELQKKQHEVKLINAREVDPQTINDFDLIMIGSPSWWNKSDGQPHDAYFELMPKMEELNLENKKFAVFGLGDNTYGRLCGAVDVLEEFVHKMKGNLVTESLRIDSFFFDQKNNEEKAREWAESLST